MSDMTRRSFLATSAAVAAAAAVTRGNPAIAPAAKPLRILILGGTGFIGPNQVRYAVARGHKVTVFNRGKTNPGSLPAGVEHLEGDRNGKLDALKGKTWDVVIDNPSTLPRWVRDAAQLLKDSAHQYLFISTISVYADNSKPGMDESAPTLTLADPTVEEIGPNYGGLKALAEKEAERAFPGRTTVVRPGLIVGARAENIRHVQRDRTRAAADDRRNALRHQSRDDGGRTVHVGAGVVSRTAEGAALDRHAGVGSADRRIRGLRRAQHPEGARCRPDVSLARRHRAQYAFVQ
jgi:nucleoside-diphosphate-sugar epimerase